MNWQTIITALLTSGFISTIVVSLFSYFLLRSTEHYRAELAKTAFEHQTQYSKLHEKRAEVIAEMYSLLTQAVRDLSIITKFYDSSGEPNLEMRKLYNFFGLSTTEASKFYVPLDESTQEAGLENAIASIGLLTEYFEKNSIYFSQSMCEKINRFDKNLSAAILIFRLRKMSMGNQEKTDYWNKVWELIDKEIPPLKSEIENEFRGLLGIKPDKAE
jgi:hypothetical protein